MSERLETLEDYYKRLSHLHDSNGEINDFEIGKSHFNISPRKYCDFKTPYNRRDFYKISLIIGKGWFKYGKHELYIDRPVLFLPALNIPYSWVCDTNQQEGYFCLFNQEFFSGSQAFEPFKKTSLFKEWSKPIIFLDEEQLQTVTTFFNNMYRLNHSNYPFRCNAIKSNLAAILHLALEWRVDDLEVENQSGAVRIYRMFDELLHKQFPLDSPAYPLELRTAADFATRLHVHVNHLNASVKSVTNLTTTQLIKRKVFEEAKNLLTYTDWNVAEIGYTLGFEEPTHFNNFFRKNAQVAPLRFRQENK
ncbi:helix-turn-helix domain-containing protein [Sphingobacterium tabacisoli]|uniref:Helix-turn-helix domain-containing protein n=1 Tax=Sphingobacterium tabacisoli TaxID=2044855 RepID=A0ABW5L2N1_9SPHI|nr:helix-turn-helix domain-containing protein [Sphingobacterium tabacisoli]